MSKGTVRGVMSRGNLEVEIDLPDSPAGAAVIAANEDAGVVVRPFLDAAQSVGAAVDEVMVYESASIRALIVSATDKRAGWPPPTITDNRAALVIPKRRRLWL